MAGQYGISKNIQALGRCAGGTFDVETVSSQRSIGLPPRGFNFGGNLSDSPPLGPFKGHVFNDVLMLPDLFIGAADHRKAVWKPLYGRGPL
jgi:hypothetical protein